MCALRSVAKILLTVAVAPGAASGDAPPRDPWNATQPAVLTPPEIEIQPASNHGLFYAGDPILITSRGHHPLRLYDWRGTLLINADRKIAPKLPVGHYFVSAGQDRNQFAILPADCRSRLVGAEADAGLIAWHTERLARIRPAWTRVLNEGNLWSEVQPAHGQWNWTRLDRTIAQHRRLGGKLIVTAHGRPPWVKTDDQFLPAYTEYLRQLCRRYPDDIYAIGIWNEPLSRSQWPKRPDLWLPFEQNSAQLAHAYRRLVAAARETVRAIQPEIRLAGAGWAWPECRRYIEDFSRLNGADDLDLYLFHDYEMRLAAPDARADLPGGHRPRVDELMARYQQLFAGKELILEECGLYGSSALGFINAHATHNPGTLRSGLPWRRAAYRTIKYVILHRAAGVVGIIPHVLTNGTIDPKQNYELYGWELGHRGPHPKTTAFLQSCALIEGAKPGGLRVVNDEVFFSEWRPQQGEPFVVAWCAEDKKIPAKKFGHRQEDLFGQPLSRTMLDEEPVVFRGATLADTQFWLHP